MAEGEIDVDKELLPFLSTTARHDLKFFAIQYFVGLSGTVSGRQFVTGKQIYVDRIVELACDNVTNVVQQSIACLINVAGDSNGVSCISRSPLADQFLDSILSSVVMKGCVLADSLAMLLSNLSREESIATRVVDILTGANPPTTFDQLIQVMCLVDYNQNADMHFLAPFLANLSQVKAARQYILDKDRCVIQRLLPFTQHESDIRRQAISTILKNCCFEHEYHDWLLSPSVDILPSLILPLAGAEEFDDEDMERLPTELQYLEPEKTREPLSIVRANLVEAVTQLCTTANGRKVLRDSNIYIIIREYHKWEKETTNYPFIMNLVDILIGEEPNAELGTNLKEILVPDNLQEQFNKANEEELNSYQGPETSNSHN